MTRTQLLELLLVERFTPVPKPAQVPVQRPAWDNLRDLARAIDTTAARDCDRRRVS